MGASRIGNSGGDADSLRAARNDRLNPPDYAPGQGDDFLFDDFSDSGVESNTGDVFSDGGNALGGDVFGGSGMMGGAGTFTAQQNLNTQQQTPPASVEDKIFDGLAGFGKNGISFFREFFSSMKEVTPKFWASWGSYTFIVGGVTSIVGLILMLFKVGAGLSLLIGGLLAAAGGVTTLMMNIEKAKGYTSQYKDGSGGASQSSPAAELQTSSGDDFDFSDESDDDFDDWGDGEDFNDGSDDFEFADDAEDDSDFFSSMSSDSSSSEPMTTEEALSSLPQVEKGMYTRQYLYEAFTKRLPHMKKDFATIKSIDEDSDTFLNWEQCLRDACEATGVKEENLPTLLALEENLFTIKLTFNRPAGLKADAVATELANIYAYGEDGLALPSVSAKADLVGKKCYITIFTGESAMISLLDMYENCKDWVLDTKNYMPVVLGIDQRGSVIKADFKKQESVVITGMPRSGKSWFVKAILIQMCAFVSPEELNIYICDPKEGISDFKTFTLPHVKKFVSGDNNIVATLRDVVKVLAPKRKRIIGDAGFQTIWDYKAANPDVKMPLIYVVVDEVVTLASRMDKETNNEFRMLLRELISQLPALGIRAFLIPHVLNNDIIEKKTSDIIDCKVSVCGDADHIEKATGSKPKEFPFKLSNKGDMAVRMPLVSPNTMFVHAPVLDKDNPEVNALFNYMTKMWLTLEPDEKKGSMAANVESDEADEAALEMAFDDSDLEDIDLFGEGSSSEPEVFGNPDSSGLYRLSDTASSVPDDSEDLIDW